MQKGELKERAAGHRRVTGSGFMCPVFSDLISLHIVTLVQRCIDCGLLKKGEFEEIYNDLLQLTGTIVPVIEARRMVVSMLYEYYTDLDCMRHWFELHRDDLERRSILRQNVADKDQK